MTFGAVAGHLAATAPCPVVIVPASWHPESLQEHPVVALTGDHPAHTTLTAGLTQARQLKTSLLVLHLVDQATPTAEIDHHQRTLAALIAAAQDGNTDVAVETRIVPGNPHDRLVQESVHAAAAVVGRPHRHGTTGWMRSVAHAVMKHTQCPLTIVPAD